MRRLRVAVLTAVAGVGFVSGCCGTGSCGLGGCGILDRIRSRRQCNTECTRLGTGPVVGSLTGQVFGDGPILEDPGACAPPVGPPVGFPQAGPTLPGPMLTPVPGTSPEPPIAQPTPAGPGETARRREK
jgi:hypothetical protein